MEFMSHVSIWVQFFFPSESIASFSLSSAIIYIIIFGDLFFILLVFIALKLDYDMGTRMSPDVPLGLKQGHPL